MNCGSKARLIYSWVVCGLAEPTTWREAPKPSLGEIKPRNESVGVFLLPDILDSSPDVGESGPIAQIQYAATRACFPGDVEICLGRDPPQSTHHGFVIQQHSELKFYGACLRVWFKADRKQCEAIQRKLGMHRSIGDDNPDQDCSKGDVIAAHQMFWIPCCFSLLSRYPVSGFLGDYLRCIWMHRSKNELLTATAVFNILQLPAPDADKVVRVEAHGVIFCYEGPWAGNNSQNSPFWILFQCLSIGNIARIVDTALAPTGRIILISKHPIILTLIAEAICYFVGEYKWQGLFVPVAHALQIDALVREPGPYILGIGHSFCSLFEPPLDALMVNIDSNSIVQYANTGMLGFEDLKSLVSGLHDAVGTSRQHLGLPTCVHAAYAMGQLVAIGQVESDTERVRQLQEPPWWNQAAIMIAMNAACRRANYIAATALHLIKPGGSSNAAHFLPIAYVNALVRERNQYQRDADTAWQCCADLSRSFNSKHDEERALMLAAQEQLQSWKLLARRLQDFSRVLLAHIQDLRKQLNDYEELESYF